MKKPRVDFLSVGSVARKLELLPSTIFALSKKGSLPSPQKIGDRFFFVRREVERCLGESNQKVQREKFRRSWELSKIENRRLIEKKSFRNHENEWR